MINNINHVQIAAGSPQANGQVERVNRVLKAEHVNHSDWSTKLADVEYAINNSSHSTTKVSLSELLFGIKQRGTIVDELTEHLEEKFISSIDRDLSQIRSKAHHFIEKSQYNNEQYFFKS